MARKRRHEEKGAEVSGSGRSRDGEEPVHEPADDEAREEEPDEGTEGADGTEDADGGEPDPSDDPRAAERATARSLVEAGRVEEALEAYRRLVDADPSDVKARHNLGVLLDELGRHAEAVEQLEAARDLEPESLDVIANLGAALGAVGRFVDAEKELRRAQRIHPEQVKVRAQLGILYFRRGLYEAAELELRWVCDRDESHGPAHFYRGEALNRLGRMDQAMECLERAVILQPDNPRAYYTLGILFDLKHMPREAAEMYRKARELSRT